MAHAPIGVMYDHLHPAGDLMLGYRFSWSHEEGLRQGSSTISNGSGFGIQSPMGMPYMAIPLEMDMSMQMIELMYAPTDWLTLMLMPMYMEMNMTMEMRAAPGAGGMAMPMVHSHGVAGWGDTLLAAMLPVIGSSEAHQVLFNLGLSMPTGSVDGMHKGKLTHYMMQLGSGTWDLQPGLTYTGQSGNWNWGAQSLITWRMEDANASGYRLGDALDTTAWLSTDLSEKVSVSGRIAWRHEGAIQGRYNAPHHSGSPPDFPSNYGGDRLELGTGLSFSPGGAWEGQRFAIEVLTPVYQDVNGVQLDREVTLYAGWQLAF